MRVHDLVRQEVLNGVLVSEDAHDKYGPALGICIFESPVRVSINSIVLWLF
jgi:hypothetical protein